MGQRTRAEIVTNGLLLAGRDDASTTLGNRWLQTWLDSVAASINWPLLKKETVVTLTTAQEQTFGNGSGGVSEKIIKVHDNLYWVTPDSRSFGRITLRNSLSSPIEKLQASSITGPPSSARVLAAGWGAWALSFDPRPDIVYKLYLPYQALPAALAGDSSIPWYPDDDTMEHAVAFKTHEFYDGVNAPVTLAAQQTLASMIVEDRMRHGAVDGTNDVHRMDPTMFPLSRK
jgi:hypothetical protein